MEVTAPALAANPVPKGQEKIHWVLSLPFFLVHLAALSAFFVGFRWRYVVVCVALYYARMFLVTTFYHRYFSHRSFKTSRVFQFVAAFLTCTCAQKGPLWWAAHHRHHHRASDQADDVHSPLQRGFWWSHVGWILSSRYEETRYELIRDFAALPELRWINRWHLLPPLLLAVGLFLIGGLPLLVWGFFVSTVLLWHGTFTINSLAHVFGRRRYKTTDTSRNNWLLALITCGEGWHNNHHYHQNTANQGWFWWEIDLSFYALKVLSWLGVVRDLRGPTDAVKYAHLRYSPEERATLRRPPFAALPAPEAGQA
ncbi:MAG TPA: fatty acid desaturase [Myxococcales bacterium]|nr:fatty acid desaturase [Myxococcales bacterium]